jgi:hypothetical protein
VREAGGAAGVKSTLASRTPNPAKAMTSAAGIADFRGLEQGK